ncbi:peroxidase family protein [Streptomyces caelestis]|uniref:peroxidase family protein n=1 Tax=Streptomyces caelestis TaxID=36816 RepID=UPI00364E9BDB
MAALGSGSADVGDRYRGLGRISRSEVVSGIPGGTRDHYGVPYSFTEEFVAVYRMHPLIRDTWHPRSATDDRTLRHCSLRDVWGPGALKVLESTGRADLLHSFGTLHPGLVTLHTFPGFLQEFERPDGHLQDLAVTDILRSREPGVPRCDEFRRRLLRPAAGFAELTDHPAWAEQIERLYDGDIEKVDLMVGLHAERPPAGFAFGDTAFRIFVPMASRRLNSDRFFTGHHTPEAYSGAGMARIDGNSMITELLRHHPELRPVLAGLTNAFGPWHTATGT